MNKYSKRQVHKVCVQSRALQIPSTLWCVTLCVGFGNHQPIFNITRIDVTNNHISWSSDDDKLSTLLSGHLFSTDECYLFVILILIVSR